MSKNFETIPVDVNGERVLVSVRLSGGEEEVGLREYSFSKVAGAIEAVAKEFTTVFRKLKPDKATVEFNVALTIETSELAAVFFDASGSGGLKVTLEWGKTPDKE